MEKNPLAPKESVDSSDLYDVAISFHRQDQLLAEKLHDAISDRVRVFVYSKKSEEVGGTDGLEFYRRMFAKQSKLTVILHQKDWGKTKYTALEESAIRDCCLNNQFRNLLIVKLDDSPLPDWVPETLIYIDYKLFGPEKTAGAILLRAQERGASVVSEGPLEKAARLERAQLELRTRRTRLNIDSLAQVVIFVPELFVAMHEIISRINAERPGLSISSGHDNNTMVIRASGQSLLIIFHREQLDSIERCGVQAKLFLGNLALPGSGEVIHYFERPREIGADTYLLDYGSDTGWHWRTDKFFYTTATLAEQIVNNFLEVLLKKAA